MENDNSLVINGKAYQKDDKIPTRIIYPFFLFHMLVFGGVGFYMAYFDDSSNIAFVYLHGGIAIYVYLIFYRAFFGREEIKWMFINSVLGLYGIIAEIDLLLSAAGSSLSDYPIYTHPIPFLYYVLYTFLLRQAVIDFSGSRTNKRKKRIVEGLFVGVSVLVYTAFYLM